MSEVPAAAVIVANLIMMAAFGFIVFVVHENTFAASMIIVESGQQLISTGPYAYVRHPMYAGALLLIITIPIALGAWCGALANAIGFFLLVILDEERALLAGLPGYDDYRHAVPHRLIPFVW